MQGTQGRRELWTPRPVGVSNGAMCWSIAQERLNSAGAEVAVAVSVTHDVSADVRAYVKANLPHVGRISSFPFCQVPDRRQSETQITLFLWRRASHQA